MLEQQITDRLGRARLATSIAIARLRVDLEPGVAAYIGLARRRQTQREVLVELARLRQLGEEMDAAIDSVTTPSLSMLGAAMAGNATSVDVDRHLERELEVMRVQRDGIVRLAVELEVDVDEALAAAEIPDAAATCLAERVAAVLEADERALVLIARRCDAMRGG